MYRSAQEEPACPHVGSRELIIKITMQVDAYGSVNRVHISIFLYLTPVHAIADYDLEISPGALTRSVIQSDQTNPWQL